MTKHVNPDGSIVDVTLGKGVMFGYDVTLGNGVALGNGVTLGNYVTLGYDVTFGNYVKIGNGVMLGNYVTLGNYVKLGDGVKLGNGVTLGYDVTLGDSVMLGNYVKLGDSVAITRDTYWCAGRDRRGYEVLGYIDRDGKLRIIAGCRDFALHEAWAHWSRPTHRDPVAARDILRKIAYLETCYEMEG